MLRGFALSALFTAAFSQPVSSRRRRKVPTAVSHLRVNQVGFTADGEKLAYLMVPGTTEAPTVNLIDASDQSKHPMDVTKSQGEWNDRYDNVHIINFTDISTVGSFFLESSDGMRTATFKIAATEQELYSQLLENSMFYFAVQRDGEDVNSSVYERKKSHLNDKTATVYKVPVYTDSDDAVLKSIEAVSDAATRDCSGGWFDAGDFIKFVQTTSYTVINMLTAMRDYPSSAAALRSETKFGLDWLVKMWDSDTQTLYYQVGIGDGNDKTKIVGDHDLLRLPEVDDETKATKGRQFIRDRPLFRAAKGGKQISPNLAGRMSAAFALGAQVFSDDKTLSKWLTNAAKQIYSLADISLDSCYVDDSVLFTTSPWAYYPEKEWCSDMELAATSLYTLTKKELFTNSNKYLEQAKDYAQRYAEQFEVAGVQVFELYDVAALAHAHLLRELKDTDTVKKTILKHFKTGLKTFKVNSTEDVFGVGMGYSTKDGDNAPNILGLAVMAKLYEDVSGNADFASFAQRQVDYVLGANGWGVSFVIGAAGEGGTSVVCPQHNIDNLLGKPSGYDRILLGAVVDGPSHYTQPAGSDDFFKPCGTKSDPYVEFTRGKWSFSDNADNWAGTEPADDYTATSVLLWARLFHGGLTETSTILV